MLHREATAPESGPRAWIRSHLFGVLCCALGAIATGIASISLAVAGSLSAMPNRWVTSSLLAATIIAATASFVRREGSPTLAIAGIAMAAAAIALGWVVVAMIVVMVTTVIILLLKEAM